MKKLRVIFMGSPELAIPALEAVNTHHEVLAVVTQPDRPQGRGQQVLPPPVKVKAEALGLVVLQPENLRGMAMGEQLAAYAADVFVVVAYGKILSAKLLAVPPRGCINVHASLLPCLRGAAPIQWAILRGELKSGITIMQMDPGMDTGPILKQQAIDLREDETAGSLHDRLAPLGAALLLETLAEVAMGEASPRPQDNAQATMAPLLQKEGGRVNFSWPALQVDRWIRGMDPWPGAFTTLPPAKARGAAAKSGEMLRLFGSRPTPDQGHPGTILTIDDRGMLVACAENAVWIRELQRAGKRRMTAQALAAGRAIAPGMILG